MTVTKATSRAAKELITVPVARMTCTACERRIAKALTALPGVVSASASTRKGTASLIVTNESSRASIEAAIVKLGYRLGGSPWLNRDPQVWRSAGVAAVFVAVLVWVVGVGDLTGKLGDLSTGGLLLVLALGLAAGVSTCMAMVGGIILAISASAAKHSTASGAAARSSAWRINLVFQAGRVGGFGLLGAALGALGGRAAMPQPFVVALMVAVAVTMLLVGVRLTELSPRIAGWSPTIPAVVGDRLGLTRDVPARRTAGAVVAGAATFFLPCGFTQAVQLYAFSTGSPRAAGVIMATFAHRYGARPARPCRCADTAEGDPKGHDVARPGRGRRWLCCHQRDLGDAPGRRGAAPRELLRRSRRTAGSQLQRHAHLCRPDDQYRAEW